MNAQERVESYLARKVKEVREWAFVYWVKPIHGRPTMISKKLVDRSVDIRVGFDIAGDAYVLDERTNRAAYIYFDGTTGIRIGEIAPSEVFKVQRWQVKRFEDVRCGKPQTVRQIMASKALNWRTFGHAA